jgi:AraC family transcriptional regulator of adaptative response/methylated-DNA-[protein]-cysteine methyltransferase
MVAAATERGVCLLEFTDRRMLETQLAVLRKRFGRTVVPGPSPHLERLREDLGSYFAGTLREFTVPLDAPGTPFEERVWAELRRIPYGETRSYEQLAITVDAPGAQRAVGRANGMNRVAIVIPCHRVVNTSGRLGGYGGGLWRKELLLRLERTRQPLRAADARAARPADAQAVRAG